MFKSALGDSERSAQSPSKLSQFVPVATPPLPEDGSVVVVADGNVEAELVGEVVPPPVLPLVVGTAPPKLVPMH